MTAYNYQENRDLQPHQELDFEDLVIFGGVYSNEQR